MVNNTRELKNEIIVSFVEKKHVRNLLIIYILSVLSTIFLYLYLYFSAINIVTWSYYFKLDNKNQIVKEESLSRYNYNQTEIKNIADKILFDIFAVTPATSLGQYSKLYLNYLNGFELSLDNFESFSNSLGIFKESRHGWYYSIKNFKDVTIEAEVLATTVMYTVTYKNLILDGYSPNGVKATQFDLIMEFGQVETSISSNGLRLIRLVRKNTIDLLVDGRVKNIVI